MGPLFFCLALHRHCEQLRYLLYAVYMDDVSVGGPLEDVLYDLQAIKEAEILHLSPSVRLSAVTTRLGVALWLPFHGNC